MSPERLLQHFDQIAEAPDAVSRLRRFILDLAVRGKLVPQDPEDESAAELLKRIEAVKTQHTNEGTIRKPRYLPPIKREEESFKLPETWLWVRIGNVFDYDAGSKTEPKYLPKDAWLLELEDIEKDFGKTVQHLTVSDRLPKSTKSGFQPGDVLYGKLRPYLNKVVVADSPGFSTTEIVVLRCYGESIPQYTCLALRRPDFVNYVTRLGQGTKMPRLRTEDAVSAPFPLPPLAEQRRIVAKVDELMVLCDELEAAQTKREKRRDRLVAATLHGLNNGDESGELGIRPTFEESACFYFNHLPRLTTRPEHIHQLRQTILNLAIRGKLVPQDPNDEPASELLKRIEAEKARLLKLGEIRKAKQFPLIDNKSAHFNLSPSWEWVPIRKIAADRGQKVPDKDFSYIDVSAIDKERGRIAEPQVLTPDEAPSRARKIVQKGDVIYSCVRPYLLNIAVVDKDFRPEPIVSTAFAVLNGFGLVTPRYLWIVLRSPFFVTCVEEKMRGQAYPAINDGDFALLPFPLPPLAEQHRIVAKVDELMALCDELEAQITTTTATRHQLLETSLHEALSA